MGAPDDWILIDLLPSVGRALWANTEDTVVVRSGHNSCLARADDAEFRAMPAVPAELPLLTLESDASVDGLRGISPSEVFVALNDWKPQELPAAADSSSGLTVKRSTVLAWTRGTGPSRSKTGDRVGKSAQLWWATCPEGVVS